ncbi:MAG TPA: serine/threonine-protein kinase, partial [Gemmatimonadaceae bacterium]|nr:serine/threonine-protein kinase [Gemmatimonadaceae bacterium]
MASADFDAFSRRLAGQYTLECEIGRGGMGVVYRARDVNLDRLVAIKTLPPELASDPPTRERFLREARTAAALSHPNIVPVYRADEVDGQVFFAMGYVDGESLAELLAAHGSLDARVVLRIMRDVALALGYAHARGVVHRDVKAENILIEKPTGAAMVTDFGIARLVEAKPLTATGQVLGTVYYMSPEQVVAEPLDGRSDLYSLGVVCFYALTGHFPFDGTVASAVLVSHVTKAPPPVLSACPAAPRAIAEIVDRCLAKQREARFQTGAELAAALTSAEAEVARDAAAAENAERAAAAGPQLIADTEAQAIWSRAAALQAQTGVVPRQVPMLGVRDLARDASRTSGYSVDNVRDAAREAGIPAQYVEHALAEHGVASAKIAAGAAANASAPTVTNLPTKTPVLAGAPLSFELEAVVQGEMSERDFDVLVEIIRRHMGEPGIAASMGRTLSWTCTSRRRSLHLSVMARNGTTTIHVQDNNRLLAGT